MIHPGGQSDAELSISVLQIDDVQQPGTLCRFVVRLSALYHTLL